MTIATDGCKVIRRHNFLAQNLEAKIVSLVSAHRTASLRPQLLYCFTVAIGLPADASDNEDKRSAVAVRMQNKVVVE